MPRAAPKPCSHPGCGRIVHGGGSRCDAHPVANRFSDARRGSRQSRGYDAAWDRKREQILVRDHGLCQPCLKGEQERVTLASEVDHVVSKAEAKRRGWTREQMDDESNLQSICGPCHKAKTAREAQAGRRG